MDRTTSGPLHYNREGLAIDVDLSLPTIRVIRSLEQIIEWREKPAAIRCDNGSEYSSQELVSWTTGQQINSAWQADVKCVCRTVRHEWLDLHRFESVDQAQQLATQWLWSYNNERPNMAIEGVPPRQLLDAA